MGRFRASIHVWTWARRATAGAFLALLVLAGFEWFPWFRGSASATTLLDVVPLVDPLAAIEASLAARAVFTDVLIGAGILLAAGIVLGPVFCGWICPLGLLLDLNQTLRRGVLRLTRGPRHVEARRVPIPASFRFAVLGAVLGFALVGRLPLFQILSPINILARAVTLVIGPALLLVVAIVLVEHLWPRLWCRALCPLGALYAAIGRWGVFRVRIDPAHAGRTPCGQCTRSCPMGIPVMEAYVQAGRASVDDPDCIRCGDCADVCPRDALRLGLRRIAPGGDPPPGVPCGRCEDGAVETRKEDGSIALPVSTSSLGGL